MKPNPSPNDAAPQRRTLSQRVSLALLGLFGWRLVTAPLPGPKGVMIVYPHTSNWDFILGLLYRFGSGLRASWMGKDSLFPWPLRGLLLRMGGVPINRRAASGFIGDVEKDLALLREYYADKQGRHPAGAGEIRFRR